MKYTCAVVVGLALDIGVAMLLRSQCGLNPILAAAIGFCAGVVINYVSFELWVFGSGRLSLAGLGRLCVAAQGSLLLRLASVWMLALVGIRSSLVFLMAAGISFSANFFFSRLAIRREG